MFIIIIIPSQNKQVKCKRLLRRLVKVYKNNFFYCTTIHFEHTTVQLSQCIITLYLLLLYDTIKKQKSKYFGTKN